MMSSKMFILPAIYHTDCDFSSLASFIDKIGNVLEKTPFGKYESILTLESIINNLKTETEGVLVDQVIAEKLLLINDINEIIISAKNLEVFVPEELMKNDFTKLLSEANNILPEKLDIPLFYVEDFPEPFSNKSWSFFNADQSDQKKYGIPFGIYIKTAKSIPIYTSFLLAHELVHVAVGMNGSQKIARGLEEGLAELMGCIYLFSRIKGRKITANLLKYNRLYYPPYQEWDVYLDNLRQAIQLYLSFGLSGIKELITKGRETIKKVEYLLLNREFEKINLPKGEWDNDVNYLVSFILSYPRSYVVSPLAKYLCGFINQESHVPTLLSKYHIDPILGEEALQELERKLFLIIIKNGNIVNSDIPIESLPGIFRYQIL